MFIHVMFEEGQNAKLHCDPILMRFLLENFQAVFIDFSPYHLDIRLATVKSTLLPVVNKKQRRTGYSLL